MRGRRHGPRRVPKKRLRRLLEAWWLGVESAVSKGRSTEQLAIELAHRQPGHHSLCGITNDCEACESAYYAAMKSGRRRILIGLDLAEEDESAEDDHQAMHWASLYQTYMKGEAPRLALLSWPQTYTDIAMVGDAVWSEAISRSAKAAMPKKGAPKTSR